MPAAWLAGRVSRTVGNVLVTGSVPGLADTVSAYCDRSDGELEWLDGFIVRYWYLYLCLLWIVCF